MAPQPPQAAPPSRPPGAAPPTTDPQGADAPAIATRPDPIIPDTAPAAAPTPFQLQLAPAHPARAEQAPAQPQPAAQPVRAEAAPTMPVAVLHVRATETAGERLVIRLDPAALGALRVDIQTAPDGVRDIRIAVEKPDTLTILHADRHQLEAALNRAGVATEPARIQLGLAPPGTFHDRPAPERAPLPAATTTSLAGGNPDGGGGHQGGQPRRPPADSRLPPAWIADPAITALRGALDITA